ncbi:hypothetical protein [Elizabethkingia anophelis]|uniref:Uncharacterized protein n=1 Tax=Elizabethkingia anophelis TaxID=1117645 RepID=A0A455ZHZ9_9FLAO|nr:hypothetical protein [Elizabethkingia anophelis]AQW92945.1 hypothetical protein BBD30_01430 [Elizabethkingia anophelis]OPB61443.1 hypothetical protein BAS07_16830 [Elizabethkingia anophelis]DAC76402.1 TPA_exp: hypothetical protein [Elizabethkingia anophelis]
MVDKKKLITEENFILFTITLATLVVILIIVNQGTSKINSSIIQKNISYNIYSLKGKDQFNGAFFLGTGRINTEEYYVFFSKDEKKGGFFKDKIPVVSTLLVEKDTVPHVVRNYAIETTTKETFLNGKKVIIDTIVYSNSLFAKPVPKSIGYEYILIVPPGTITENQTYEPL